MGSGVGASRGMLKGSSGGKKMFASITILRASGLAPILKKPGEGISPCSTPLFTGK